MREAGWSVRKKLCEGGRCDDRRAEVRDLVMLTALVLKMKEGATSLRM